MFLHIMLFPSLSFTFMISTVLQQRLNVLTSNERECECAIACVRFKLMQYYHWFDCFAIFCSSLCSSTLTLGSTQVRNTTHAQCPPCIQVSCLLIAHYILFCFFIFNFNTASVRCVFFLLIVAYLCCFFLHLISSYHRTTSTFGLIDDALLFNLSP